MVAERDVFISEFQISQALQRFLKITPPFFSKSLGFNIVRIGLYANRNQRATFLFLLLVLCSSYIGFSRC